MIRQETFRSISEVPQLENARGNESKPETLKTAKQTQTVYNMDTNQSNKNITVLMDYSVHISDTAGSDIIQDQVNEVTPFTKTSCLCTVPQWKSSFV